MASVAQGRGDDLAETLCGERFGEEAHSRHRYVGVDRAHQHHRHDMSAAAQAVGQCQTIEIRHPDVGKHQVDIGVRHLPVMDSGQVAGVVSTRDLVLPLLLGALVGET